MVVTPPSMRLLQNQAGGIDGTEWNTWVRPQAWRSARAMRRGGKCHVSARACAQPRALVTIEIVREREDGDFALLPMGVLLRSDAAPSLRAGAILVGGDHWQEWGHLLDSVKTGESVRQLLTGTQGSP
jgi:hypothetical protein